MRPECALEIETAGRMAHLPRHHSSLVRKGPLPRIRLPVAWPQNGDVRNSASLDLSLRYMGSEKTSFFMGGTVPNGKTWVP